MCQYGLILPPSYENNSQRRYPVIFLLHGGDSYARAKIKLLSPLCCITFIKVVNYPTPIVVTPDGNDNRGTSAFGEALLPVVNYC
jgi:predicted alpha/beta superfamily hydrolase